MHLRFHSKISYRQMSLDTLKGKGQSVLSAMLYSTLSLLCSILGELLHACFNCYT